MYVYFNYEKIHFLFNINVPCYERLVIQTLQLRTAFVFIINIPCYEKLLIQTLQLKTALAFTLNIPCYEKPVIQTSQLKMVCFYYSLLRMTDYSNITTQKCISF